MHYNNETMDARDITLAILGALKERGLETVSLSKLSFLLPGICHRMGLVCEGEEFWIRPGEGGISEVVRKCVHFLTRPRPVRLGPSKVVNIPLAFFGDKEKRTLNLLLLDEGTVDAFYRRLPDRKAVYAATGDFVMCSRCLNAPRPPDFGKWS